MRKYMCNNFLSTSRHVSRVHLPVYFLTSFNISFCLASSSVIVTLAMFSVSHSIMSAASLLAWADPFSSILYWSSSSSLATATFFLTNSSCSLYFSASASILSISSADSPLQASLIVQSAVAPVVLSLAVTLRIPLESSAKVTSI